MPFFYNSLINARRILFRSGVVMLAAALPFSAAIAAPATATIPRPAMAFVPPSKTEVLIRQYLYEADDALAHGRLTSPRNDNALAGYQRVLALDPRNQKARAGISNIGSRFLALAKKAEQGGDFERALGYARQAQRLAPAEGSAQMVKHLQQRRAEDEAQQLQMAKAPGAKAALKSKGNEYFLAASDVARRNLTAKSQLAQIAEKAQGMDSRLLILAKNDGDGRWMYSQMRDSLTSDYRLRANIKVDSQTKIVLLDQPPEGVAPAPAAAAATAPAAVPVAGAPVSSSTPSPQGKPQ